MKVSRLRCVSWIALLSILLRTVAMVYGNRDHCQTLIRDCDVTRASSVLGSLTSDNMTQTLMCTSSTVGMFSWYRDGATMMEPIMPVLNKYTFMGLNNAMLTVRNVNVEDEGRYYCLVNNQGDEIFSACLLAYVPAEFKDCPRGLSTPRTGCTEEEMLDATTENKTVQFNVALTHKDVPSSCYNQTIASINFSRRGDSNVSITCDASMCVHTGDTRYTVNRESGFNIVIELVNQTTSDSGEFFVRAELREAGENIRFCVYKNFTLSVTAPTTPPPTTEGTSTSNDVPADPLPQGAVIGIVVAFVVLVIPLVILVVAVVLLCSLTCYRREQEKKKSKAIYEDTDHVVRRNGGSLHKLLGQADAVSQNEADGVGELNPNINSEHVGQV